MTLQKMRGAILPGNSTVELREFDVPVPGHGEVLVRTKSSTICGSLSYAGAGGACAWGRG